MKKHVSEKDSRNQKRFALMLEVGNHLLRKQLLILEISTTILEETAKIMCNALDKGIHTNFGAKKIEDFL